MLQPAIGTVIFGRYRLRREIARGGQSWVWEAEDRKLRRSVAIKILFPVWAKSQDASSRFEREAMAVAQLQSAHVVQIFDYGVERECPFIVMELLEGEDLRTRLRRVGRLSLEATAVIVVQTAKALGVAHAAGIVHRDLKPGNVFLVRSREEEMVKVLDFGVAKAAPGGDIEHETTKEGAILGTPRYMSPEQALASRSVDHRTDLWSLAVIAFRAVTGKVPFGGKSAADIIVRLCTERPPRATSIAPDLPPEIDGFFETALRRDPAQRYQSARELAKAFADISPASFPSLNMPTPPPEMVRAVAELRAPDAPGSAEEITHPGRGEGPDGADLDEVATIAIPGLAEDLSEDEAATRLAFPTPPILDMADDTPTPAVSGTAAAALLTPTPVMARAGGALANGQEAAAARDTLVPGLPMQASPLARLSDLARRRPLWFGAGIGAILALGGVVALMSGGGGSPPTEPAKGFATGATTASGASTTTGATGATASSTQTEPTTAPTTSEITASTASAAPTTEAPVPSETAPEGTKHPKSHPSAEPSAKPTAVPTAAPTSAPTTTTSPTTKTDPFQDRL
jgi:eukaryotic-like serine/threonine-protein kinase